MYVCNNNLFLISKNVNINYFNFLYSNYKCMYVKSVNVYY